MERLLTVARCGRKKKSKTFWTHQLKYKEWKKISETFIVSNKICLVCMFYDRFWKKKTTTTTTKLVSFKTSVCLTSFYWLREKKRKKWNLKSEFYTKFSENQRQTKLEQNKQYSLGNKVNCKLCSWTVFCEVFNGFFFMFTIEISWNFTKIITNDFKVRPVQTRPGN